MKKYTLGIIFNADLSEVLLIKKKSPEWQKGKLNFIGGKVDPGETFLKCIVREVREETGLNTMMKDWTNIGRIVNKKYYEIGLFVMQHIDYIHGIPESVEGLEVSWQPCDSLPENAISNITMLTSFAKTIIKQGNIDTLKKATFTYEGKDF